MGMPGSTEHLDQLMCRVISDLLRKGSVIKIADDRYIGGNTVTELIHTWEQLLKTTYAHRHPKLLFVLKQISFLSECGSRGKISPSPHRTAPLTSATFPVKVKSMRSFCGSMKHLKACISNYSSLLAPIESATAGKDSKRHIQSCEKLSEDFEAVK